MCFVAMHTHVAGMKAESRPDRVETLTSSNSFDVGINPVSRDLEWFRCKRPGSTRGSGSSIFQRVDFCTHLPGPAQLVD